MKSRRQIDTALAQRRANAAASAEGRPLPFANPWDTWDPTKVPQNASDEEIAASYQRFSALCRKRPRKRHVL